MFSNRLAVVLLGVGCITAAGLGGYFAARQNTVPTPAAAQEQPVEGVPLVPATAERPVQETEALVGDTARPKAAPVAAEREPSPVTSRSARRSEPPPSRSASAPPRARTTSARNDPAPLSSSWPSSASSQPPSPSAPPVSDPSAFPRNDERTSQEPARAPEPPQRVFEELVVSADSVLGLQTENRLSSDTARVEDKVEAKVTRDVKVGDRVAIPAGSHAIGSVMEVERGGKFKDRARLGIRFHTLVLADGTRLPISTKRFTAKARRPATRARQRSAAARWAARFSARFSAAPRVRPSARPRAAAAERPL